MDPFIYPHYIVCEVIWISSISTYYAFSKFTNLDVCQWRKANSTEMNNLPATFIQSSAKTEKGSSTCHGMLLQVDLKQQFANEVDSDRQFSLGLVWLGFCLVTCMLHGRVACGRIFFAM